MRNKSEVEADETKESKSYIVHAVRYAREETSIIVTAQDEEEAEVISKDMFDNDDCTWETDHDYCPDPEYISVEEYG